MRFSKVFKSPVTRLPVIEQSEYVSATKAKLVFIIIAIITIKFWKQHQTKSYDRKEPSGNIKGRWIHDQMNVSVASQKDTGPWSFVISYKINKLTQEYTN
jgi:hypothetical protein